MTNKSKENVGDLWQMSLRAIAKGEQRGMALELYHPLTAQHFVFELWGNEVSYKAPNSQHDLALRQVLKFEKKLREQGLTVPDFRERLLKLVRPS